MFGFNRKEPWFIQHEYINAGIERNHVPRMLDFHEMRYSVTRTLPRFNT